MIKAIKISKNYSREYNNNAPKKTYHREKSNRRFNACRYPSLDAKDIIELAKYDNEE